MTAPTTAAPDVADDATPFSVRLRLLTRPEHEAAEGEHFVGHLLEGRLDVTAYADLLAQNHALYAALEAAVAAHLDDPVVRSLAHPGLVRLPSVEADLRSLVGVDWRDVLPVLPATERYVTHLRVVAAGSTPALVAHHYLRYLGDLSGGQVISRLVGRAYDLPSESLRAYAFPDLPRPKVFKDTYRAALDAAPWTPHQQQAVVEEVRTGFGLGAAVLSGLGRRHRPGGARGAMGD